MDNKTATKLNSCGKMGFLLDLGLSHNAEN
jgi:hypothetical protein